MEFIDYMWIKAGVLCVLAFIAGLFGFTGQDEADQPQEQAQNDKPHC